MSFARPRVHNDLDRKIGLAPQGLFGLTSPRMADKQTSLILDALVRAAAEPSGLPPYSTKSDRGLFPNTATGKAAARRALDEHMIQSTVTSANGNSREVCTITERGFHHLIEHVSPRKILEDFVRVLEERREQVEELIQTAGRMAHNLEGLKTTIAALVPSVQSARLPGTANRIADSLTSDDLAQGIVTHLSDWRSDSTRDCPLPELYKAIVCGFPDCTIGRFHDALRKLQASGQIYLHPWTGPLYAVPEPTFALLVGHNVAYYASAR